MSATQADATKEAGPKCNCADCGRAFDLDAELTCAACVEAAEGEAYDDGYDEGHDDGHNEAVSEEGAKLFSAAREWWLRRSLRGTGVTADQRELFRDFFYEVLEEELP